jgi:hypothetical protein
MRPLILAISVTFLAVNLSPAPARAEQTTEISSQAKKMAKPRDCSRVGRGFTGWRAREARRFCRMG